MAVVTWDGSSSTAWTTGANWDTGSVPTSSDDVIIANVSNDPVIADGTNPEVKTIELAASATLTCGNNTITVNDETSQYAFKGIGTLIPQTSTIVVTTDADTLIKCENGSFNNLTINPDGGNDTVTLYSAITVGGNLIISGGTLDTNSSSNYALNVTGNTSGAGTLALNNSTYTGDGHLSMTGTVTIGTSGVITGVDQLGESGGTITCTGSPTLGFERWRQPTANWTPATSTIKLEGHTRTFQTNGYGVPYNLEIDNSGKTNQLSDFVVVTNNLTIAAGTLDTSSSNHAITVTKDVSVTGTLTGNASAITAGSITINSGGTYSATSATTTLTSESGAGYHIKNDGTFTHNNGTVTITGPTDSHAEIRGFTSSHPLNNLILNNATGSGVETRIVGNIQIERDFTLTDGHFDTNGQGPLDVVGGVSVASGATFDGSSSTISHGSLTIASGGTYTATSGTTTINGGVRNLGTFNSNHTLTIGGTGGILEGNLDDANVNVNLDPALDFDGSNDYLDLNYGNSVNAQAGFSVSFWAKLDDTWDGTAGNYMAFGSATGTNQRFYIGTNSTRWSFGYASAAWSDSGSATAFAGKWHHVCVTATSGAQKLYVNGVEITAQAKTDSSSFTLASDFYAGAGYGGVYHMNTKIADVKMFTDVLTAAEVQQLGSKINCDSATFGLNNRVGWWKLNEGTGTTATDYDNSGSDYDGAISGATWVFDQYSVNVQDNSTTTDGTFTVTQGKVECKALSALTLDGTGDYLTLASSVELEDYDWSISCWFRADEFSSNTLLGHSNGEHLIQFVNSTTLRSVFSDNGNEDITVSGLSTDKWHHLVYTRDDSTGVSKIYIDGVYNATGTFDSGANFVINRIGIESNDEFDGEMRDIRIYDAMILSDDQVSSLYSGSYNVTPTHWWKCDEGTGTTANDTGTGSAKNATGSGNAALGDNNGTLDLDGTLTIAANGTFNGPRGTLQIDGDITGAGTFNLLTGSGLTLVAGKTFTGTSTSSQLTVDIPDDLNLEIVGNVANLYCKSGTDMTVIGAVTGCTFEDSTANIRQWHHTLDTKQLLDADEDGDDDLRLTKPALDNAHELMTG